MKKMPNKKGPMREPAAQSAPQEHVARGKHANGKRAAESAVETEVAGETLPDARPARSKGANWSAIAAVVIVAAVIAIPLYLKSRRAQGTQVAPSPEAAAASAKAGQPLPRFLDIGTTTCKPCKIMLGVMDELKQQYPGAMVVDFINVKEKPDELERFGITVIPAQIFYAPDGKELYRHTGVFKTEAIIAKWAELGYPMKQSEKK